MFVVRASVCSTCSRRGTPTLATGLRDIAADPSRLDELWPGLTRIAIDHAVAEPAADAGRVVVVPAPFPGTTWATSRAWPTLLPASGDGALACSATPAT